MQKTGNQKKLNIFLPALYLSLVLFLCEFLKDK